ncbi:MAG: multicopper oxidase family protein [Waterburya sp.]
MMKLSRREALKLGIVGTGTLISPFGLPSNAQAAEMTSCEHQSSPSGVQTTPFSPQIERFKAPLKILQPLEPKLRKEVGDGTDYYEITMEKQRIGVVFDQNEQPLHFAEFWTYDNSIPGPLIRQKLSRQSSIRFINLLDEDAKGKNICTSIHLHGMASLPQYDGYAEDLIEPNYYKDYYYPNSRASTLWYHDHAVHNTSRNVYMGLAGMYIVEYADKDFCGETNVLPSGEFEIPLVIQDKTFEIPERNNPQEWRLVFNNRQKQGVYADVMLVNGRAYPTHKVKRQKYYFRLLNASASRTYQLTLSRNANRLTLAQDPLIVVGSDAGLLAQPDPLIAPKSLRIGVGERYGVVIDFAQFPTDVKTVYLWDIGFISNIGGPSQAIMQFELTGDPILTPDLPNKIGKVTLRDELIRLRNERLQKQSLPITASDQKFRFERSGDWKINNKTWEINRVDAKPGLWDVEIWEIRNTGGWVHPVHIHLVDFQIIDRNGMEPYSYERGWKDVVLLGEFETIRVIASFNPQPGKYMIHCHNIVHEDHDMMTQFEIIGGAGDPPPIDPMSARAQKLPATPLGTTDPPPYPESDFTYGPLKTSCQEP